MGAANNNPKRRNTATTGQSADFFIDGQNFFLSTKTLFGYQHPNFDIIALCRGLAALKGLALGHIHFYTGMPGQQENPCWHDYWSRRLEDWYQSGVHIFNPPMRYHTKHEFAPNGEMNTWSQPVEKGVDVRIALDMVKYAHAGAQNIILLSRDNDLGVAAAEVRSIARDYGRRISVASAYPATHQNTTRGVDGTTWIPISKSFYDKHLDPRDFRSAGMKRNHDEKEAQFNAATPHPRSRHPPRHADIPGHQRPGFQAAVNPGGDALRFNRANQAAQAVAITQAPRCAAEIKY